MYVCIHYLLYIDERRRGRERDREREYKELAQVIMEAEKSHDLQLAS